MATIIRFEDLECWKKSRILVAEVYRESSLGELQSDYDARSQFRRAAISVMNNIAEGFARKSNKEFIRFLGFSDSSAAELKSMIYVFEDIEYFSADSAKRMHNQIDEIRKLILGLIRYLRSRSDNYLKEDDVDYFIKCSDQVYPIEPTNKQTKKHRN